MARPLAKEVAKLLQLQHAKDLLQGIWIVLDGQEAMNVLCRPLRRVGAVVRSRDEGDPEPVGFPACFDRFEIVVMDDSSPRAAKNKLPVWDEQNGPRHPGAPAVSLRWLRDSLNAGMLLDPTHYVVKEAQLKEGAQNQPPPQQAPPATTDSALAQESTVTAMSMPMAQAPPIQVPRLDSARLASMVVASEPFDDLLEKMVFELCGDKELADKARRGVPEAVEEYNKIKWTPKEDRLIRAVIVLRQRQQWTQINHFLELLRDARSDEAILAREAYLQSSATAG